MDPTLGFSRWFVTIFSVDSWSLQGHCRCVIRVVNETKMSSKRPGVSQCAVHHSAGILTLPSGAALTNNERKALLQMRQRHFNRVQSHTASLQHSYLLNINVCSLANTKRKNITGCWPSKHNCSFGNWNCVNFDNHTKVLKCKVIGVIINYVNSQVFNSWSCTREYLARVKRRPGSIIIQWLISASPRNTENVQI